MSTSENFGWKVRALRKQRGYTQEQLAQKMERSVDSVSQLERGVNLPSFETLDRLSAALDVPVRDFFDQEVGDRKRTELISTAISALRAMDDRDLTIAVDQILAFAKEE